MPAARSPFDWNDIPILVALARRGSMRTAGRELGVTTSTVSRRLAAAEQALQTRLFIRGPEGYRPTDAGRLFFDEAAQIEGRLHALLAETHGHAEAVRGAVRVTSVDVLLHDWLVPQLPALCARYPELELRAIADNQVLSFTRGESDLAIRVTRPVEDAAILMRRIATVGVAVYAAPGFADAARAHWNELPWLSFDDDLADAVERQWQARHAPAARVVFRSSSMSGLIRACEAGLGVALLPCFAVAGTALRRIGASPAAAPELQRDLYLLSHRQAGRIRRFRVVADWIAQLAERDAARLAGTEAGPPLRED